MTGAPFSVLIGSLVASVIIHLLYILAVLIDLPRCWTVKAQNIILGDMVLFAIRARRILKIIFMSLEIR